MLAKSAITIVQRTMFVNQKSVQLAAVIRMLIGLTDIFANLTRQKVRERNNMVSVTCPCAECVHNGARCKCKAKNINLRYRNMATVNEGRVDMWICDKYELTPSMKKLFEIIDTDMRESEDKEWNIP